MSTIANESDMFTTLNPIICGEVLILDVGVLEI